MSEMEIHFFSFSLSARPRDRAREFNCRRISRWDWIDHRARARFLEIAFAFFFLRVAPRDTIIMPYCITFYNCGYRVYLIASFCCAFSLYISLSLFVTNDLMKRLYVSGAKISYYEYMMILYLRSSRVIQSLYNLFLSREFLVCLIQLKIVNWQL